MRQRPSAVCDYGRHWASNIRSSLSNAAGTIEYQRLGSDAQETLD